MIGRRMAAALAAATLTAGLMGVPAAAQDQVLRVFNWNDYIAPETLTRFTAETGIRVTYDTYDSNEVLDARLRAGRSGYDLVVPSASPFLAQQIPAGLYQPLDRGKIPNWRNLDPAIMRGLEHYDPGNRFAVPWMWGTTGIGYNVDRVRQILPNAPVNSLRMVFDPQIVARFRGCGVEVLDSPTDVFPAALAFLGLSPDSKALPDLTRATEMLQRVRPNIRRFHSSEYINDLANGDACVVFGYSGDIIQAARRAREANRGVQIAYAIPLVEGALQWTDAWAIPVGAPNVEAAHRFLDFLLRPEIAALNTNFIGYANAVPASLPMVDAAIRDNASIYPPDDVRRRFYLISPAERTYERARTRAWTRITTGR
jgi:putrescine transport system substrate-binding protein